MKLKNLTFGIFIGILVLNSCKKDVNFDTRVISAGTANFTKYVAVGNSLTQGHQDFGVHNEKGQQNNSFPAILARQMKLATPSMTFKQPLVPGSGSGAMNLIVDVDGELTPVNLNEPNAIPEDPSWSSWAPTGETYNNLGVSGIRLSNCVPTDGNVLVTSRVNWATNSNNPYGRFLDWGSFWNPTSYLDHIKASNATFFTCWLGNNDVLGWALAGGLDTEFPIEVFGVPIPFIPSIKLTPLTPVSEFRQKYDKVLDAFQQMGAKGVCATIPNVSTIPNLNTINEERIGHPLWITVAGTGTIRLATSRDLIPLTAINAIRNDVGKTITNPLPDSLVLDRDEVSIVSLQTILLNSEIEASAKAHNYPVLDMYAELKDLESGILVDGISLTTKFIEGGAFSLDGVHPNERGYAMIANKFIRVINQTYNASIPLVDIGQFKGIYFPN